jgi:hypothetical protein
MREWMVRLLSVGRRGGCDRELEAGVPGDRIDPIEALKVEG